MNKNTESNQPKRRVNRLIVSVAVVATVVWMSILLILLNNVSGSTDPIRKVGDQFQVPSDWVLTSERIVPPRFFCIGDIACPSLSRAWSTKTRVTKEILAESLLKSGWNFTIQDDCNIPENRFGNYVSTCWMDGTIDDYNISVWVTYNSNDETQYNVTIDVSPSR